MPQVNVEPLTSLELYSRRKAFVNISWRHHQLIHGIVVKAPVLLYILRGIGKTKQAWARLTSGHLKTLKFSRGHKKFSMSTKCNMIEATPQHLLDCVALLYDDLLVRPDFVLEVMKANDLMDVI
ncbi:hypothetical protein AVEN_57370-1 [Araneus ventricosus]|uniref:Uncharacterized protein n=1 Tax=Araneus ventricosus TaxID=182803 RepID=A0A4Y2W3L0_ARAVE|nr:hypothetical protein AVEN_271309-1 [Araneus ventricosus]GBO31147.1 hypothetical protein AVEN_57370-1 [Araneus ventricosus]